MFRMAALFMAFSWFCLLGSDQLQEKVVTAIDHLRCTASWDGTEAGKCSDSAEYTPPPDWVIVSHEVLTHSENNGGKSVSVLNEGRELRASVSAKAHGSVIDQKRGWADISVKVTLRNIVEPPVEPVSDMNGTSTDGGAETEPNPPTGLEGSEEEKPIKDPEKEKMDTPGNRDQPINGNPSNDSWVTILAAVIGGLAVIIGAWITARYARRPRH